MDAVRGAACVRTALAAQPFAADRVVAVGKAAAGMYQGASDCLTPNLPGLVVTKHGHAAPLSDIDVAFVEASHPIPDAASLAAGERLLRMVRAAGAAERWLVLISGGASALAEVLKGGMTLAEWQARNQALIAGGADIHAINAARREWSLLKDGRWLANFSGAAVQVLAISDVSGDDINVIGSGLGAVHRLPAGRANCRIIASNAHARDAAAAAAAAAGEPVRCNEQTLDGELFAVARRVAAAVRSGPAGIYLFGGEPTVTLPPSPGEGGRNQSMALALARELSDCAVELLAAGTDGTDGPTDAAGAWLHTTGHDAARLDAALANADAGTYLAARGERFVTGPTHTNVMDLLVCRRF